VFWGERDPNREQKKKRIEEKRRDSREKDREEGNT